MDWTFLYLMVALKLPIAGLAWIVWWAVRAVPEVEPEPTGNDDGGTEHPHRREPSGPRPRRPRRGPHGDAPVPAPERTRRVAAQGKRVA